ncbi:MULTISPECIES: iron ABC transporter permease [unclassified Rhizobium]|uniref:ABC transporter permease n=1 Tax=unclassified Rhizobium TaxID=2613769 RepID=UPI001AE8FB45|nr:MULTISPECIES: iron ABC transporter permease [unclassified Rhizobium]MBP2462822.1 iron(III) transport system permease protein [Rhizobium sp. PvP014]MBP2530216.1 iron(III) transport system permease protein [Rhizobium sp. PvP099]
MIRRPVMGRPHRLGGEHLLVSLLVLYVSFTTLWPLARLFSAAFQPGEDGTPLGLMLTTLASRSALRALSGTLQTALLSVAVSTVIGVALAFAVSLLKLRTRAALTFLILIPLIVPSQTMALAWIELFGAQSPILKPLGLAPPPGSTNPLYSTGGIALVMGIEHMPLVFIAVRAALRALPADLVEAARILGISPGRIGLGIVLPIVMPSVLAGSLIAFTAAIGNFGVPALLGIPGRISVLTTLIYQRLNGFGPAAAGQVATLALMLAAMAALAIVLRNIVTTCIAVPLPAGTPFVPTRRAPVIEFLLWIVVLILSLVPLAALTMTALLPAIGVAFGPDTISLDQFRAVLDNPTVRRAFANSLLLAVITAAISMLVAVPLAFLSQRRTNPVLRLLDFVIEGPWVVPGTVVALGMILAFLKPLPLIGLSLYGTMAILVIAYLSRFLPLVLRPVAAAAQSADPALDEAARITGAGLNRRILSIFLPGVLPAAAAGAILVVMTALNELTLSTLLWSSGNETIGVMIFALQYEGNSTGAAAVAVLSTLLVLSLAGGATLIGSSMPKGTLPWLE